MWLDPGLDPGVGFSLEYKCGVIQSPPGDYLCLKWWDNGPISRAEPRRKDKSGNPWVVPKGTIPIFLSFPVFFVPQLESLLGFYGLTVLRLRWIKVKAMHAWLSPAVAWLHDLMVAYLTDAMLATVTGREGYVSWGVQNLFLTPANDRIHDCIWNWIREWTREWDSALNTSAVWTNRLQGVIPMISGGAMGRFCEPSRSEPRRKDKIVNPRVVPKGAIPVFPSFPVFFVCQLDSLRVLTVWPSSVRGESKIQAMPISIPDTA